jgi:4,5-dihydroxyphthalate decarboxylase
MNNESVSRRRALRSISATSLGFAGIGLLGSGGSLSAKPAAPDAEKLPLNLSGYHLDRVDALIDGRVPVEGCDVSFEVAKIGDMNSDVFGGKGVRDVTEIGLSPYMHAFANDGFRGYSLIPVFPLRLFRHKSIFIRTDRGISKPADLKGKKIATVGYSSTSLTWIRGIMQHEYGVAPEDVQWYLSSKDSSAKATGAPSKQESVLPKGIKFTMGPDGKDESDMLADGDVDALFHAAQPRAYVEGHAEVARLFPDYRKTERAYFAKTGIFPIMHAVAIRNDLIDRNPWLPKAVFEAYSAAKKLAYDRLRKMAWYQDSLPWIGQEVEETRALMGDNYWPYGIAPNRKALESLFTYSHEQGLASRKLKIEELFHPSTLELIEG